MFGISVSNLHTQQAQAEGFTRPLFCCFQPWRSHKYLSGSWLKRKFTRFKRVSALHIKWTCIFFFLLVSFHHDNLKTAATQQITINACPFLICSVIIICAKKKRTKCYYWMLCSRPPVQKEQSEPFAKHKGYPWCKVTCTMMASVFFFFFFSPFFLFYFF